MSDDSTRRQSPHGSSRYPSAESLETRRLLTTASLVIDLHSNPHNSYPQGFTAFQDAVFFSAADDHGRELWKTDGTADGTELVKDIVPGSVGSAPKNFIQFGEELYFTTGEDEPTKELWRTDGTSEGTKRVPGSPSLAYSPSLTALGDKLYFVSGKGKLWRTDGTGPGTQPIDDADELVDVRTLTVFRGELYFNSGTGAKEIWKTNGTSVELVSPVQTGGELVAFQAELYFGGYDESSGLWSLWKTTGSAESTTLVRELGNGSFSELTEAMGSLFFIVNDGDDSAVWKSDGTASGTAPVVSPASPSSGFSPFRLIALPDRLLIIGFGGALWSNDGTDAGIQRIGTIPVFRYATVADAILNDEQFLLGSSLWKTDGTEPGTIKITDVGAGDKFQPELAAIDGELIFNGSDEAGLELWKSDGTNQGTEMVADIFPGLAPDMDDDPTPRLLTAVGGRVFFLHDGIGVSDGTADGTEIVFSAGGSPLASFNDSVVFTSGHQLWKSDGTDVGTAPFYTLPNSEALFDLSRFHRPRHFTQVDDQLFFTVDDVEVGRELWKTDGTSVGTQLVADLRADGGSSPRDLTAFKGELFFQANRQELWKTNGTSEGTELIKNLDTAGLMDFGLEPLGSTMFFSAHDREFGRELWKTDGTEAGTVRVKDIFPGRRGGISKSDSLTASGDLLYFVADGDGSGDRLWQSDGTESGTVPIAFPNDALGRDPQYLTDLGGELFFTAVSDDGGRELWLTDGTAEGTKLVKDIFPGRPGSDPADLTVFDGRLYFSATDGEVGRELWVTDGSDAGTRRVLDIRSGAESSVPKEFTVAGDKLLFTADDGIYGRELWVVDASRIDADINGDRAVDFADFVIMAENFGQKNVGLPQGDADGDEEVTFADFLILSSEFGRSA